MSQLIRSKIFLFFAALFLVNSILTAQSTSTASITPPNYNGFTPPPRGGSYVDPAFGTTIRRLSDAVSEGTSYVNHEYSKISPFNSNSTWVLLEKGGGIMHVRDLNGNIVRDNLHNFGILPTGSPLWSRTDPNILYFHPVGGNQIKRFNVSTTQLDTLYTFSGYTSITFSSKGDISWDGDRIPVMADNRWVFVYRISTSSVIGPVDFSPYIFDATHDTLDIAPQNNITYIAGDVNGATYTFSQNIGFMLKTTHYGGHGDRGSDLDGADVLVLTNSADVAPIPNCQNAPVKVRMATGAQQCLQQLDWSLAVHISCHNVGQGSCIVSTYSGNSPSSAWPPYTNEIFKVNFDGSPTVRLAHSRASNSGYNFQPHAAVSPDGKYILFDTDMLRGTPDVYLLMVPGVSAPPPPADTTPPTISGVGAANISTSGATISWTTNESSNSQVDFGLTTAYGLSTALDTGMTGSHSQALSGLAASTLYHYRVKSRDAAGNLATSGDFTFTTATQPVTNPTPTISNVAASSISTSGATVTWATNVSCNSQVEYGTTTNYSSSTTLDSAMVTSHSQGLAGLAAGTMYHYRVKSVDGLGTPVASPDATFTTTSVTPPPTGPVTTRYQQDNPAIAYSGPWAGVWYTNTSSVHSGGTATLAMDAGSRATFQFNGTAISWIGYMDAWSGLADVYLDGVFQTTVNTYSAASKGQQVIWSRTGLSSGKHTLIINVNGKRRGGSKGSWVWIDALDVVTPGTTTTGGTTGGTTASTPFRIEQDNPAVAYTGPWPGVWFGNTMSVHSGASALLAMDAGSRATLTFTGTAVTWIAYRDAWSGIANVYVDGALRGSVDTYSASSQAQVPAFTASGLSSGIHTLTIEATQTQNASSGGSWIWVDAFDVTP